jgi:eukaryotic-like serine/threonine-protein kinase
MALTPGFRLGAYEIVSPLGAGGMGEVYRARDTKLGRDVAIKILPEAFAADPERLERFEREARALAALNHPNIATIYGLEQDEGNNYLTMELVTGTTLAERLTRGAIAVEEALHLARQITQALQAAHEKGIVHRDLKPANVKVTPNGVVKLLDFGLAKSLVGSEPNGVSESGATMMGTVEGRILGTPGYMSPEQTRGRPVDERSDIWAFGCVLYEMLAGRPAFTGLTPVDRMAAVLRSEADLAQLAPGTPESVRELLRQCLQKDPSHRPAGIANIVLDREDAVSMVTSGRVSATALRDTQIRSLAVLPFANASGDPQMEYFSDGLTESLIFSLSQLPQLRVMARATVFRYRGRSEDAQQIGRALKVSAVLTGVVLQRGETLMISTELVDVDSGWHLWGAQFRKTSADVFAMEEAIAKELSDALRLKLTPETERLLARRYTENVDAYHLYLKGRHYWGKRTEDALKKGIHHFREALDIDPTYALAYAGLADCYIPLAFYGHVASLDALPKARAAAHKALEIDPRLAGARSALGWVRSVYDRDPRGGEEQVRAALEVDPNYARGRQALAEILVMSGRADEAIAEIKRAIDLDPLSLAMHAAVAMILYLGREHDGAIEYCRKAIEMEPGFFPARWFLGLAYQGKRRFAEAVEQLREADALSGHSTNIVATLGGAFAASGNVDKAQEILSELSQIGRRRYVPRTQVAAIFAGLGDHERALAALEAAYQERCVWLRCAAADPRFDALRELDGFRTILRLIGLR